MVVLKVVSTSRITSMMTNQQRYNLNKTLAELLGFEVDEQIFINNYGLPQARISEQSGVRFTRDRGYTENWEQIMPLALELSVTYNPTKDESGMYSAFTWNDPAKKFFGETVQIALTKCVIDALKEKQATNTQKQLHWKQVTDTISL